jgi:RIO kinase 1
VQLILKTPFPFLSKDATANRLLAANRKAEAHRIRATDKADRATNEQVLDPRTRMMLFKLLNRGVFDTLVGGAFGIWQGG